MPHAGANPAPGARIAAAAKRPLPVDRLAALRALAPTPDVILTLVGARDRGPILLGPAPDGADRAAEPPGREGLSRHGPRPMDQPPMLAA